MRVDESNPTTSPRSPYAPTLAILPGLLILFTVISFNYVGDGLRDAIDPKAIRR